MDELKMSLPGKFLGHQILDALEQAGNWQDNPDEKLEAERFRSLSLYNLEMRECGSGIRIYASWRGRFPFRKKWHRPAFPAFILHPLITYNMYDSLVLEIVWVPTEDGVIMPISEDRYEKFLHRFESCLRSSSEQ